MPLEGGKGAPNIVTVTHYVAWNAPLPASWSDTRGNTIYRHVYRRRPKPVQTPTQEHISLVQAQGSASAGGKPSGSSTPAWVYQRQRYLRARGFNIRVDGVWGSRSQRAWELHRKALVLQRSQRREAADLRSRHVVQAQQNARRAAASFDPSRHIEDARLRARSGRDFRADEKTRNFQLGRAEKLRPKTPAQERRQQGRIDKRLAGIEQQKRMEALGMKASRLGTLLATEAATRELGIKGPRAIAEGTNIRTIAEIFFDPSNGGFDYENPESVKVLQRSLRGHGHDVKVDGVYGQETFKALVDAWDDAMQRERRQAVREVRDRYYRGGLLKAGDELPSWWMLPGFTRVPRPGELLSLLQSESFGASVLFNTLEEESQRRADWAFDPSYVKWRNDYLRTLAGVAGPFNTRVPGLLSQAQLYLVPDSEPFLRARSFEQLRGEIERYERRQEREYVERMRREMEESKHWFVKAWDDASEWFRWQIVDAVNGIEFIYDEGPLAYIQGRFGSDPRYYEHLRRARASVKAEWEENAWKGIAARVLIEPLNFVPGAAFRLPFVAIGRGSLYLERVGYTLSASGRIAKIPGLGLTLPARSGRFAAESSARTWQGVVRSLEDAALYYPLSPLGRAYVAFTHATRLKTTAEAAMTLRMRQAKWAGFRASGVTALKQKAAREAGQHVDGWEVALPREISDVLDATEVGSLARLSDAVPEWQINALVAGKVSLKAGVENPELSAVGLHFQARYKETARIWAADSVARSEARAYALRKIDPDGVKTVVPSGKAYEAAYEEGLAEIRKRIGFYFEGGLDPAISAAIRGRLYEINQRIDDFLLPMLQKRIEAAVGEALWDEAGLWVGRQGDLQMMLRQILRKELSYEDSLRENPLYGRYFSKGQKEQLAEDELQRRAGSKMGYARVREAAGEVPPGEFKTWDDWIEREVFTIEKEIDDAWEFSWKHGAWTDTRRELRVPNLYAGHLDDAADEELEALFFAEHKAQLKQAGPVSTVTMPRGAVAARVRRQQRAFEDGRGRPIADDANAFPEPPSDPFLRTIAWIDGVRPNVPVPARDELGVRVLSPLEEEVVRMNDFKDVVEKRMIALRAAEEHAHVEFVRREGLFWEALRHTENRPLRMVANTFLGLTAAWKFSVLALRPAWFARNNADNTVKVLLQGVIDPRFWFSGGKGLRAGEHIQSVFSNDLRAIREFLKWADSVVGDGSGRVVAAYDAAVDQVWGVSEKILARVFWMHGIPVSERALREAKMANDIFKEGGQRVVRGKLRSGALGPAGTPFVSGVDTTFSWAARGFYENAWELMGTRPENYYKRVLYRTTYAKAMERGLDDYEATKEAWAAVEHTLFDYSKISAGEEGLKPFMPFIQFWRKNTVFWLQTAAEKPWFFADVYEFEQGLQDAHADWPAWMRRYIHTREISDVVARVPGLRWLGPQLADLNVMYDPLNFLSFAPLYRAFKGENPTLPKQHAGLPFISGFVDGMNDFGLGINPLIRKPLEVAGVLNYRAWQSVFPQTQLIEAFTQKFWHDRFPTGLDLEAMLADPVLQLMGQESSADLAAANFNTYVQMEMTNQRVRGEDVSRARAEEKIRDYFLVQTVIGYFVGMYVRRMTPEDFYLYQIAEALHEGELDFKDLSAEDQENYRLWKLRKGDALAYDRYVEAIPTIRAFFNQPTAADRQEYLAANPDILPYVSRAWSLRLPGARFIQLAALGADTDAAMDFYEFVSSAKLSREFTRRAETFWVTPELRRFWEANDTSSEQRSKMIRGGYFRYLSGLTDAFHSIPENDFEARQGFLAEHPELQRWWNDNNSAADDYKMILNSVNAALREVYFEHVDAGDWASADRHLRRFPFMFEFTSAAGRVSEDGEWILDKDGNRIGRSRSASQHAQDYLAAKRWLDYYFSLAESQRASWLNGGSDGARVVKTYFAKYSSQGGFQGRGGMTQHAQDYLAAKSWLDHYFSMSKSARRLWLNGGSHGAVVVRSYFKKYSKAMQAERSFLRSSPVSSDPEVALRLKFWKRYYSLTPDKRPRFVIRNAERYGIFVYGVFGDEHRHDREQVWRRKAFLAGLSPRATAYLYVKPLLDLYFTLSKSDKGLFLRANPEVAAYLDKFAQGSPTGDAKLDNLLDRYFDLPYASNERAHFLQVHPEVQDYFDSRSTPEERAMHNLLEVYFDIRDSAKRRDFLRKHPEIQAYFDKRQRERSEQARQFGAFDEADPRLAPYKARAREVTLAGDRMRRFLALRRLARKSSTELSYRRTPAA